MEIFEEFKTWEFLGGIGIFLFAMFSLENAIRDLARRSFKRFIRERTSTRLRSISTGTIVTAVLQSSSAVSLMVLAFVGAGIMAMENAIGVILGSNIGTTATAWIVATIGFKLDIASFALSFIGIGGVILIFLGKSRRYSNIAKLLVSFGFLFMGLSFMKGSMEHLTSYITIEDIPDYGVIFYLLIGALLTAAMQSSSATIALILTGLHSELLGFEDAASMVIGANIGTTATILLGGIRSTQIKKRVAASHLIFNVFSAIIGLILLWPLSYGIQYFVGSANENAVIGIALFHTIFNLIGVIAFYPFIRRYSAWLIRIIPDKRVTKTKFIHGLSPMVYDAAYSGIKHEIGHLTEEVMTFNRFIIQEAVDDKKFKSSKISLSEKYEELKILQAEIFKFSAEVQTMEFDKQEGLALVKLLHNARRLLDSAKTMKDIRHDLLKFREEDNSFLQESLKNFADRLDSLYKHLENVFHEEDHIENAGEFSEIITTLKKEDRDFVKRVMEASRSERIEELVTSELLLTNRNFNHSNNLLLQSILEWKLTDEEQALFEELISPNY